MLPALFRHPALRPAGVQGGRCYAYHTWPTKVDSPGRVLLTSGTPWRLGSRNTILGTNIYVPGAMVVKIKPNQKSSKIYENR